ncbi:MAG: rRNA pseudouridine synthase, partial [Firmicutes bacterium]|nr:rRNA pseudouridine synthase [Bacillota bacterium]
MASERLQRYLARAGVASRRAAEEMIRAGLVSVNGRPVTVLGTKIDPDRDEVTIRGRRVEPPAKFVYLMIHKPSGYVTTMRDPEGRPTVASLLPPGLPRVFPVGRLDLETTGLLLFTNDGELAHALLHPSRGVWKTYRARVRGVPSPATLARLRRGVMLEDGPTAPAAVKILSREDGDATLAIEIHEGRKRQVRRMLAAVGHPVLALTRIGFGPLALGDLAPGAWRPLRPDEVLALHRAVGRAAGAG